VEGFTFSWSFYKSNKWGFQYNERTFINCRANAQYYLEYKAKDKDTKSKFNDIEKEYQKFLANRKGFIISKLVHTERKESKNHHFPLQFSYNFTKINTIYYLINLRK